MDAGANTVDVSTLVTVALPTSGTVPPSTYAGGFRYNTTGLYLQSRPTTGAAPVGPNAASLLLARLQNDSGATVNSLVIAYDLAEFDTLAGEIPGHYVYFSLTGAPGSWQPITTLSGQVSGSLSSGSLDLSAFGGWAAGATMYVMWADDNANGITDPGHSIDNLVFSSMAAPPTPPSIVVQPVSVTVNEGQVARLSVSAAGTSPLTYQWYLGGSPIAGATAATLTVTNMAGSGLTTSVPSDSGAYYVIVTGLGEPPTVTSDTVTVTVNADVTAPSFVYARCNPTNDTGFILTVSEALDNSAGTVDDVFTWAVYDLADPGSTVSLLSIAYAAGDTNIYFTADFPRDPTIGYGIRYRTEEYAPLHDVSQAMNDMALDASVLVTCFSNKVLIADTATWSFDDSGTDVAVAYRVPTFDDSGWKTGVGVFDGKRGAAATPDVCRLGTVLSGGLIANTCIAISNATATAGIPTVYFRKHFTLTAEDIAKTTMLRLITILDDGAAFYINGRQLTKLGMPALPLDPLDGTLSPRTVDVNGLIETTDVPINGLTLNVGDNVLSAEVHQVNLTSSDITFGLQLVSLSAEVPAVLPSLTIVHEGANVRITWTGAGTLQYKDDIGTVGGWADQASGFVAPGEYLIPADQAHRFFSLRP